MDEQIEREKLSLRREELSLERKRLEADIRLHDRELDLRDREVSSKSGKDVRVTGSQVTILVAFFSLASAAIGAGISGYFQREVGGIEASGDQSVEQIRAKAQIDLEQLKFESGLIIKAIEQESADDRIKLLRFFANAGLIPRHKESILNISGNPENVPNLGRQSASCPFVKRGVTFAVDPAVESDVASHLMKQLSEIYRQWSLASGLSIVPANEIANADIQIGYSDSLEEITAYAEYPCDGHNARIYLNKKYEWKNANNLKNSNQNARFLFSVLLHEAGHTIGIPHSEMDNSVMSMPQAEFFTELTASDVAAARTLYGSRTSGGLRK